MEWKKVCCWGVRHGRKGIANRRRKEEKQLSLMSRMLNIRSPDLLMFDHGVQDDQELAHASSKGHFPGLARPTKTVVKGLDDRVISGGG